jgi:hypothetical protein
MREDRIRIEARKAPPDDAGVSINERPHPAIADQRKVKIMSPVIEAHIEARR